MDSVIQASQDSSVGGSWKVDADGCYASNIHETSYSAPPRLTQPQPPLHTRHNQREYLRRVYSILSLVHHYFLALHYINMRTGFVVNKSWWFRIVSSTFQIVQILVQSHFELGSLVLAPEATEPVSEPVTQMAVELINNHLISVQQKR